MPNFNPPKDIDLYPDDDNKGLNFIFKKTTGTYNNDGFIPYGLSVSSVEVSGLDNEGSDTTGWIYTATVSISNDVTIDSRLNDVVSFNIKHPGTNGTFFIKIILTLDNGTVLGSIFKRVQANGYV